MKTFIEDRKFRCYLQPYLSSVCGLTLLFPFKHHRSLENQITYVLKPRPIHSKVVFEFVKCKVQFGSLKETITYVPGSPLITLCSNPTTCAIIERSIRVYKCGHPGAHPAEKVDLSTPRQSAHQLSLESIEVAA